MKLDSMSQGERPDLGVRSFRCSVRSETDILTEVLLCRPAFLAPVACCSVTRESLRDGFATSVPAALAQHDALHAALERQGVSCHFLDPDSTMPDLCFTRDALVTTPWGVLGLRPAARHRRAETKLALDQLSRLGATIAGSVCQGTVEGGDIAIVREGLVLIGCSGERTDSVGAEDVVRFFREKGWEAIVYPFDPHFLHLDTQFAMVGENLALACVDVLSDHFLAQVSSHGIETIAVTYKEARGLGCNMLALGGRRLIASANNDRVVDALRERDYAVETLDLDQFTRCGGGVHCLTMPLLRTQA